MGWGGSLKRSALLSGAEWIGDGFLTLAIPKTSGFEAATLSSIKKKGDLALRPTRPPNNYI